MGHVTYSIKSIFRNLSTTTYPSIPPTNPVATSLIDMYADIKISPPMLYSEAKRHPAPFQKYLK